MAIPTAISSQLSALDDAINSAGNLDGASFPVLNALAFQAGQIASAVEAAIAPAAGALDTWSTPLMPQDIATGFLALADSAGAQSALADLEGFVARIEINLENR